MQPPKSKRQSARERTEMLASALGVAACCLLLLVAVS